MARNTAVTCDTCGAVKGIANHWFAVDRAKELLVLRAEDVPVDLADRYTDLCSENCLHRAISAWCAGVVK
jgi:hypothetical protein